MNTQSFNKLLVNPDLLNANTLPELEQLIEAYPYAENFRILYALNLLVLDDFRYQQNLTKAAFYSSDRKKLKYLVDTMQAEEKEDFSQITQAKIEPEPPIIIEKAKEDEKIKSSQNSILPLKEIKPLKEKKSLTEDNKEDRIFEREKQIKQIRTKAELLRLVKKRLAQIEANKKENNVEHVEKKEQEVSNSSIINRFIKNQPSISRPDKKEFYNPQNEAIESTIDDDEFLITETLARIHADQGNLQKAIEIYQKLILKIPEKSSYFAARIQDLNK